MHISMIFLSIIYPIHLQDISTLHRRRRLRRAHEGDAHDLGQGPADQGPLELVCHLRGRQTEVAAGGAQHHLHGAWGICHGDVY